MKKALKQCRKRVENVAPHILHGSKNRAVFQGTFLESF